MSNLVGNLIASFMSFCFKIILTIINGILSVFNVINLPAFDTYSAWVTNFWDVVFQGVGYIRSAFMIGSFEMNLIYLIILLKLTVKPSIALIKLFVQWWDKLKL